MTNQPCVSLKKPRLSLTSADCVRLEAIALSFGVEFQQIDEATYRLRSSDAGRACDVLLSAQVAHFRLLAEICSRASKWVYFNFAVSPRDSLLRQSDARLLRVASFYRAELDAGIL